MKSIPSFLKMVDLFGTMAQTTASFSFLFNYHKHDLRLVSESSNKDDHNKTTDEEEEEELKVCDVCVTPISSPPYYECVVSCKYFVHSICYSLPKTFSPSPFISPFGSCGNSFESHRFKLYTSTNKDMDTSLLRCGICNLITNGRVYECEKCNMVIDVNCASLPDSIRHASHPHHKCVVAFTLCNKCQCCGHYLNWELAYRCGQGCGFVMHFSCAMLPTSITMPEWDRYHPLMLSSDAGRDHPSDFICDSCEKGLDIRTWMYYCSKCEVSFHTRCLKTESGVFKNVKFGRRFALNGIHAAHPLTFNCVTIKTKCDLCLNIVYNYFGFECGSCNFVVCLSCGRKELALLCA